MLALAITVSGALASAAPADTPRLGDERVLFRTTRGDLVFAFYPDVAPKHAAQILKLVKLGVYDSTWVHRVEPKFVVQFTNAQNRKQPLTPGQRSAIAKLPAEFSSVPHGLGVLSMAREDSDPNSAETSFSVLLGPAPHLDGKYTVFGEVVYGLPLLAMLSGEPREDANKPRDPPVVEQALVKTAEEIARMRGAGELRQAQPSTVVAQTPGAVPEGTRWIPGTTRPAAVSGLSPVTTAGIILIILCNLVAFLFGPRWPPQTRGALNLLSVLIAAFVLLVGYGSMGMTRGPLLAMALFFGIVALFKLLNRFESAPPAPPAPSV